jgi:hypothetical protein
MCADILSRDFKSRLQLRTKTVGAERIQRAKDNNEDVAILSMFLPGSVGEAENRKFRCYLAEDCFLGDYRQATPGKFELWNIKPRFHCLRLNSESFYWTV